MINPRLYLAFGKYEDADSASKEHLCLCRNEDILLPDEVIYQMTEADFNVLDGFELIFGQGEEAFMVGFNRFKNAEPMYGKIEIQGSPTRGNFAE